MYVGKSPSDDMKVPDQYHGVAVDGDGVVRGVGNDEELRRAEEMFRRGYVFESDADTGEESEPESKAEPDNAENEKTTEPRDSADAVHNDADTAHASPTSPAEAVSASAKPALKKTGGLLSDLFGRISSEDIILIGLIIILFGSGADDELLIMLAVLLIC